MRPAPLLSRLEKVDTVVGSGAKESQHNTTQPTRFHLDYDSSLYFILSTMVWFSGTVLGQAFSSTEAEDPLDLCRQLLPNHDEPADFPFHQYRMWIQVTTPITGKPLWFDVVLASRSIGFFQMTIQSQLWDGRSELNTIIRKAGEPSPHSSLFAPPGPHPETPVGKPPPTTPQSYLDEATLSKSLSGLTEKDNGNGHCP